MESDTRTSADEYRSIPVLSPSPALLPFNAVVGRRVKAIRTAKGWTQRDLTAKLAEMGVTISQPQLARIEQGRVQVALTDALAIAVALDVFLENLITTVGEYTKVEVAPTLVVEGADWLAWLRGPATIGPLLAEMKTITETVRRLSPADGRGWRWDNDILRPLVANVQMLIRNPLMPLSWRGELQAALDAVEGAMETPPEPSSSPDDDPS